MLHLLKTNNLPQERAELIAGIKVHLKSEPIGKRAKLEAVDPFKLSIEEVKLALKRYDLFEAFCWAKNAKIAANWLNCPNSYKKSKSNQSAKNLPSTRKISTREITEVVKISCEVSLKFYSEYKDAHARMALRIGKMLKDVIEDIKKHEKSRK